ncbi:MAG: biopolymer transporter ExbD [Myxococcales bacterium]|nr:biopolymer transporter ExbD [Myxococcales bacterium]
MAGGKLGGGGDDPITDINIVPLVDIILVVLIIFMVTATYIVKPAIKIDLPDAATGENLEPTSLGISVAADGRLLLDGALISEPELKAKVSEELAKDKDVVCLIAGDRAAKYGDVVHMVDLVKTIGVTKFAMNIDPNQITVVPP